MSCCQTCTFRQKIGRLVLAVTGTDKYIMDIKVWAKRFANYVRVVAASEPGRVADLRKQDLVLVQLIMY